MKLVLYCPRCGPEHGQFLVNTTPQNGPQYEIKCPDGHIFVVDVLYHHFDQLFEAAVISLSNSDYRGAIGAFAASYESFLRLFIRLVISARGISQAENERAWQSVAKQSERQLGAYVYAHLIAFNAGPLLVPSKQIQLRNRVIHQGYFPSKSECMVFGESVLASIRSALSRIHEHEEMRVAIHRSMFDIGEHASESSKMSLLVWPLIGSNRAPGSDDKTLDEMVDYIASLQSLDLPIVNL